MSYFQIQGANPPGHTAIETITGDTGGAVSPDISFNVNLLGGGSIVVSGNPGTNTLTITDQGISGTATTIGAVTADVLTIALGATPGTYTFSSSIAGFESTTPAGVGYAIVGAVRTTGVAAVLLPTQAIDHFEDTAVAPCTGSLVVSGNNAIFRVLGTAGLTISWKGVAEYVFRS